jgi:hypothetical protein
MWRTLNSVGNYKLLGRKWGTDLRSILFNIYTDHYSAWRGYDSLSIQYIVPFLAVTISYNTLFEIFRRYEVHIMFTKGTKFIIRLIREFREMKFIFHCSKHQGTDSAQTEMQETFHAAKILQRWNSVIKQELVVKNLDWIPPEENKLSGSAGEEWHKLRHKLTR